MFGRTILIAVLAVAGLGGTANAGRPHETGPLPNPTDKAIVVPTSIGGISIGQTAPEAEAAWGDNSQCFSFGGNPSRQCEYGDPQKKGFAFLFSYDGTVVGAQIGAPVVKGKFDFRGPLRKFRTVEGLGLGSKFSAVAKAYPEAKERGRALEITEGESRMTFFASRGPKNRITQITLFTNADLGLGSPVGH